MPKANLKHLVCILLHAIGLTAVETRRIVADEPAAGTVLTTEQKAALAAVDARLAGVEAIAAKIDDPDYKAEVARQIDELKRTRLAVEKNFDQGRYEALMHSVISRYQVIGLWLKAPPSLPASEQNKLTPDEAAAGWRLLFDGKSLAGWRGYRQKIMAG